MASVATVDFRSEVRPVIVTTRKVDSDSLIDGELRYITEERRAIAHMTKTSMHGGFVVEYEDGTVGEAVQGVNDIRFLDSDSLFDTYAWDVV